MDGLNRMAAMKWVTRILSGVGAAVPAWAWFSSNEPPLFEGSGLVGAAVACLALILGRRGGACEERDLKRAGVLVLCGLFLFSAYLMALGFLSIRPPAAREKEGSRLQIGFYDREWSLTAKGNELRARWPDDTPQRWVLSMGEFSDAAVRVLWKPWAIFAAGGLLVLGFVVSVLLWTYGFTRLDHCLSLQPSAQANSPAGAIPVEVVAAPRTTPIDPGASEPPPPVRSPSPRSPR